MITFPNWFVEFATKFTYKVYTTLVCLAYLVFGVTMLILFHNTRYNFKLKRFSNTSSVLSMLGILGAVFFLFVYGASSKPNIVQQQLFPMQEIANTGLDTVNTVNAGHYHNLVGYIYDGKKKIVKTVYDKYNHFTVTPLNNEGQAYLTMNTFLKKHPNAVHESLTEVDLNHEKRITTLNHQRIKAQLYLNTTAITLIYTDSTGKWVVQVQTKHPKKLTKKFVGFY